MLRAGSSRLRQRATDAVKLVRSPDSTGDPFLAAITEPGRQGLLIRAARHIQRPQCLPGMSAIHCRLQKAKSRSRILVRICTLIYGDGVMFDSPTSSMACGGGILMFRVSA